MNIIRKVFLWSGLRRIGGVKRRPPPSSVYGLDAEINDKLAMSEWFWRPTIRKNKSIKRKRTTPKEVTEFVSE